VLALLERHVALAAARAQSLTMEGFWLLLLGVAAADALRGSVQLLVRAGQAVLQSALVAAMALVAPHKQLVAPLTAMEPQVLGHQSRTEEGWGGEAARHVP
jgi:hypothetical protein